MDIIDLALTIRKKKKQKKKTVNILQIFTREEARMSNANFIK